MTHLMFFILGSIFVQLLSLPRLIIDQLQTKLVSRLATVLHIRKPTKQTTPPRTESHFGERSRNKKQRGDLNAGHQREANAGQRQEQSQEVIWRQTVKHEKNQLIVNRRAGSISRKENGRKPICTLMNRYSFRSNSRILSH